ncbi:MAG TPA: matrixin family metalloprotease [Chthoniobacterales bacterium]|jgi:hypothetical protein|nr:matrixin family metalloprotease [Chthoniobacterales bacterium]
MRLFGSLFHSFFERQVVRLSLAALLAAIVAVPCSNAYVLHGKSWPSGSVVILQLALGNAGRTLQDGNTSWDEAVLPAPGMWNAVLGRVRFTNNLNPQAPVSSGDRVNTVVFSNSIFGQSFGSGTLAVTYYTSSGSSMVESDTLFNRAAVFDSYRGSLQFIPHGAAIADIRRVFLHELGHTLGLGHPDQGGQRVTAVMNSIVGNQEDLSSDDIAGGQSLYGVGTPSTPTPTPIPTATPSVSASHLANISTRMRVGTGQSVLIGGFIIKGLQPKTLILRAIGPSLSDVGVANVLLDPKLEVRNAGGGVLASNDDWQDSPQSSQIEQSGVAPRHALESAVVVTLAPGSYTAVVSGFDNGVGNGLVEAYEVDGNATRLVNISTRGRVGNIEEPMIGGLIIQGGGGKKVIVRALGPSLGAGLIGGVLADPVLELRDSSGNLLAVSDDWPNSAQANEIIASTIPPVNALESAIVATLPTGNYTAIVRGVDGGTGIALVEVFDLDP